MLRRYLKLAFLCFAVLVPTAVGAQVKATAYEVNLTWQAPPNSTDPVAGYFAYRSPAGGSAYAQLDAVEVPLTSTAYSDVTVQGGQTYDYIVESVDANGVTSAPSNVAVVSIPPVPPVVGQATVKSIP